jgi:hypothetical protein
LRIKGSLLILLTVSLGTAWAMASKDSEDASGEVVGAVTKVARTQRVEGSSEQTAETHFDLSAIKRPIPKAVHTSSLFDSKSWYTLPPAPPVPAYVPPPQPVAPSIPFSFIGRMLDVGEVTLFLSRNDRQYTVKVKDVLDDTYRIDRIGERDAVLTYLPTNTQQTLSYNTTPAANALISATELKAAMRPGVPPTSSYPRESESVSTQMPTNTQQNLSFAPIPVANAQVNETDMNATLPDGIPATQSVPVEEN